MRDWVGEEGDEQEKEGGQGGTIADEWAFIYVYRQRGVTSPRGIKETLKANRWPL